MAGNRVPARHGLGDPERREAGPAPEFELVRPYVGGIVDAEPDTAEETPGTGPRHAASDRPTAELGAVPGLDDDTALVPIVVLSRWRANAVPLGIAAVALLVAAGLIWAYVGFSSPPKPTAMPAPMVPAGLPNVPMPSSEPSAPASPTPAATTARPAGGAPGTVHHSPHASASKAVPSAHPSTPPATTTPTTPQFPPQTAFTGTIVGLGDKCLDNNGAVNGNGNRIQIYDCNGSAAQVWTWESNGTLRVQGQCLQVTGTNNGALAELWDCNGSSTEVWRTSRRGTIVNNASGLCLEVPGFNTNNGTQLDIASCDRQSNQRWTVRPQ
ncbi:MAG TPA: ricin-type beta-trefoil lectin domain protein [Micromonosporaceae bacterium]|jgi:hypothetical protein